MYTRAVDPGAGERNHRTKGLLRLTMACNERCPFCNVPVEHYPDHTPTADRTETELEAFLDAGERTLTISGGEPTLLRARLLDVVAKARQRGVAFVELQTNAILIDDDYAAALAASGLTSGFVSLLSHVPELHDELAGLAGAFPRCLRGIDALLDAGVAVTLNPVLASTTQQLVADFVDFVAERLPRIRSISLSAVQPHGRARDHLDLLPDYAVLADSVRAARGRARAHGIELLNPYCGLPLCVGWEDDLEHSVEAAEAAARYDAAPGLDNTGNKRHGPPCRDCALRTRCGGAWHEYWDHRAGSGLAPPAARGAPWCTGDAPHRSVIRAETGIDDELLDRVAGTATPTVWVRTDRLARGDGARLWRAGCTDLAVDVEAATLLAPDELTAELRRIDRANRGREAQAVLRVAVCITPAARFADNYRAVRAAAALGADAIRIATAPTDRWSRFLEAVRDEHSDLDVAILPTS